MKVRTSLICLLVVCGIGVSGIGTAAAQPAGPPAGYKIDPEFTKTSPDGAITIEQYVNKDTDYYKSQFWVRRQGTFTLLDPEPADYPAGFRFTNDLARAGRCRGAAGRHRPSVPVGDARSVRHRRLSEARKLRSLPRQQGRACQGPENDPGGAAARQRSRARQGGAADHALAGGAAVPLRPPRAPT